MKKTWLLFVSITLVISLLAACTNSKEEINGAKDEPNTEDKTDENTKDEKVTEEGPVSEERAEKKTLHYSVLGESKEESSTLTNSDEQNYSIYKLDGYSLAGEEPNKDSLYLDENSAVSMRVETISKDEASYEVIANNMIQSISKVSIGREPVEIDDIDKLPQGEGITNSVGYETTFELGTVSGYVFEQGNLIVRLTIFDQKSVNLTDAFLKMGETVAMK